MCSKPYLLNGAVFFRLFVNFDEFSLETGSFVFPEDIDGEFSGANSSIIDKVNKYSESNQFLLFFKNESFIKGTNEILLNVADNKIQHSSSSET